MNKIENELIISSGGNKGISLLGALNEFSKTYPLYNFKYLTGCSIGSIICLLLILNYTLTEINEILFKINFGDFQECKLINLIEKSGLDEGIKFTNFLKALFLNKDIAFNITFIDLFIKTNIIFTISVVNITNGKVEYYNHLSQPDMSVLLCVRMSANIPLLFSPVLYNNNYYVDGALLDPFPFFYNKNTKKYGLWLFDDYEYKFVHNLDLNFIKSISYSFDYIPNLLRIIHINYIKEFYNKIIKRKPDNVIFINFEYSKLTPDNFNIEYEDKIKIYNFGVNQTKHFFNKKFNKKRKRYLSDKYFKIWLYKSKQNI
jgi:predicted patatin/cPLA2 family phospholipase